MSNHPRPPSVLLPQHQRVYWGALRRLRHIREDLRGSHCPNRQQLAAALETHVRTVQRDLDFLRDQLGAPIEYDRQQGGYRLTDPTGACPMCRSPKANSSAFSWLNNSCANSATPAPKSNSPAPPDLAPYASLVQRFGRCNREGKDPEAFVYWIDRPLDGKDDKLSDKPELEESDWQKIAQPYAWDDLQRAQGRIAALTSAAPADLPAHSDPYRPAHVLRRRDLVDLFDTTPDLSGYDLDVSRFVRGGEERDITVAWRDLKGEAPGKKAPALTRNELCPVSIGEFREFLKAKNKQGKPREAWRWDALEGNWEKVGDGDLRPGLSLLLDVTGAAIPKNWVGARKAKSRFRRCRRTARMRTTLTPTTN
jgi:hypothetical protein